MVNRFVDGRDNIVCPNCASLDLRTPPTQVDGFVGAAALDGRYYCANCGREGIPLIFSDKTGYEKFLARRSSKDAQIVGSSSHIALRDKKQKKAGIAVMLSLFIPGLGHVYSGHRSLGGFIFFTSLALAIAVGLFQNAFILLGFGCFYAYILVDAAVKAGDYNKGYDNQT